MKLTLSNSEKLVEIDPEDYERFKHRTWRLSFDGYVITTNFSCREGKRSWKIVFLHNEIMGRVDGLQVDHANRDKLDNRRANLRRCTRSQNLSNRPTKNKTGFRGVFKQRNSNKFGVKLQILGKRIERGGYLTLEEAARAYDDLARKHHGEYAMLNFS